MKTNQKVDNKVAYNYTSSIINLLQNNTNNPVFIILN